ncbi:DUF2000 family protein [Paraburkholderia sp. MM5482-R1]|uniref:DUF2000 family protein n=1 Tax=unclassified Paraburkholderia TaxID=2615204 RepID=UPI003D191C00
MYSIFAFVAADKPFGIVANALAHASVGLAVKMRRLNIAPEFLDASQDATINASATGGGVKVRACSQAEIRRYREEAVRANLPFVDFVDTMTGDTYVEQLEKTKTRAERELQYYSLVVVGPESQFPEI